MKQGKQKKNTNFITTYKNNQSKEKEIRIMFYMNNLTIKMENKKMAAKALEILKKDLKQDLRLMKHTE